MSPPKPIINVSRKELLAQRKAILSRYPPDTFQHMYLEQCGCCKNPDSPLTNTDFEALITLAWLLGEEEA